MIYMIYIHQLKKCQMVIFPIPIIYHYIPHYMGVSENSVPHCTQWFSWSLSLLNGYFIGNIPNIFRQTHIYPWYSHYISIKYSH